MYMYIFFSYLLLFCLVLDSYRNMILIQRSVYKQKKIKESKILEILVSNK